MLKDERAGLGGTLKIEISPLSEKGRINRVRAFDVGHFPWTDLVLCLSSYSISAV